MNVWWRKRCEDTDLSQIRAIRVLDLACGSGEVTEALGDWIRTAYNHSKSPPKQILPNRPGTLRDWKRSPPPLSPNDLRIEVYPTDPYTAPAYEQRIHRTCATLSFQDIASGELPTSHFPLGSMGSVNDESVLPNTLPDGESNQTEDEVDLPTEEHENIEPMNDSDNPHLEMAICSFALHLIETPSQLYGLLTELSQKTRWLVVIAPHKKPEIKSSWGWLQWNLATWESTEMGSRDPGSEILQERVHLRVYRSLNF
ncbi:hypothetical protein FRC14_003345 [Serendipita sp. 396]|nr:hypothetical protein FRC14_003345 [Serendipita sp. 396]